MKVSNYSGDSFLQNKRELIKKIILGIFILLLLYALYSVFHLMAPFIISAVLIYLLAPVVTYVSERKIFRKNIPRSISVIIIYIIFLGLMTLISVLLFPMLYSEGIKIATELPKQLNDFRTGKLPGILNNFQHQIDIYGVDLDIKQEVDKTIGSMFSSGEEYIQEIPHFVKQIISGFFSALTSFIAIFIFTAFVLIDLPKIKTQLLLLIPPEYKQGMIDLANAINRDLNGAIRGQLLICLLNGAITTIGLVALGVKFAVTIGIIAGVFSMIPVFGTIFSTIPAMLVASTQSWFTALQVLIFILIIHLIEANFFNPKIMGTSVELHPAIIIFSIFIGEHLFGIPGLLLAVPVVAIVRSLLTYIYKRYFLEDNSSIDLMVESKITEEQKN